MRLPTYHIEGVVKVKEDRVEDFSGPLDLILALLSKNKIEIRDIKISLILDQYLEYLEQMKKMDLEIASEFIVMASQLMQLKTKMLLTAGDEETLSELELLMQSLEERRCAELYARVKENALLLNERSELGRNVMVKQPEPLKKRGKYEYRHEKEDLVKALREMMERNKNNLPPSASSITEVLETTPFPVARKASQLVKRLISTGKSKIRALFVGSGSRSEIVATFLAVLELCKMGMLKVSNSDEISYAGKNKTPNINFDDTD